MTFAAIEDEYRAFARQIGLGDVSCIPVSALKGDKILTLSDKTSWYHGPTVLGYLEAVEVDHDRLERTPFRMLVRWVNRPHAEFRGLRVAEVAKLMVPVGLIALVSFISPFRSERRMARALVEEGEFIEVFVDAPLAVAEERDPKGLYEKAQRGELKNFTGMDSPYETPEQAEIRVDTGANPLEKAAEQIIAVLEQRGVIGSA